MAFMRVLVSSNLEMVLSLFAFDRLCCHEPTALLQKCRVVHMSRLCTSQALGGSIQDINLPANRCYQKDVRQMRRLIFQELFSGEVCV